MPSRKSAWRKDELRVLPQERHRVEGTPHTTATAMFALARESRGKSRQEAAAEMDIPLFRVRAIERGEQAPTNAELLAYSKAFNYPLHFFFQRDGAQQLERDDNAIFMCGDWVDEAKPCSRCGAFSWYLCDFPMGKGKTCDLPLCLEHRHRVHGEPDEDDPAAIDYCPQHALMAQAGAALPTIPRNRVRAG